MRKSVAIGLGLLLAGGTVWAQQYLITTVAGGGVPVTPAPAVNTAIGTPFSVAAGAGGSVYFTASNCLFRVDAAGVLTRVAGNSTARATRATEDSRPAPSLTGYQGVAVDGGGNLYLADTENNAIRKVAVTGIITTVAGTGSAGYSGDRGPGTIATLDYPSGVAVDAAGNVYIADSVNRVIRKLTATTGIITTVAGSGSQGDSGDGGPATSAQFWFPEAVALDGAGNLYISDSNRIRKVAAATGIITTVAGTGLNGYSGDGGPAAAADLNVSKGVAVDDAGNIYIADLDNSVIRKVTAATGIITTVAGNGPGYSGDGGPATGAQLDCPGRGGGRLRQPLHRGRRIERDPQGGGGLAPSRRWPEAEARRIQATEARPPAPNSNQPYGVAVDAAGNLYIADSDNNRDPQGDGGDWHHHTVAGNGTVRLSGDGGPATSAQLNEPSGVAVDGSGNLYIADDGQQRDPQGDGGDGIITTVAGDGTAGYSGDGGPATSAQLSFPRAWRWMPPATSTSRTAATTVIRKVTAATGIITTVAGNGTLGYSGDGGPATSAELYWPLGRGGGCLRQPLHRGQLQWQRSAR